MNMALLEAGSVPNAIIGPVSHTDPVQTSLIYFYLCYNLIVINLTAFISGSFYIMI